MAVETHLLLLIALTGDLALVMFWFVLWRLQVMERQLYSVVDRRADAVGARLDRHIDRHPGGTTPLTPRAP